MLPFVLGPRAVDPQDAGVGGSVDEKARGVQAHGVGEL